MDSDNIKKIVSLNEIFYQKCFEIVEKGVEAKKFLMKDVANCLGISKQVASKIVNPSNPRALTAFELLQMSVLIRIPITNLIPMNTYMTDDELKDTELCEALSSVSENTIEIKKLVSYYMQLPAFVRRWILGLLEEMQGAKWE